MGDSARAVAGAPRPGWTRVADVVFALCLLMPWLNPFAPGPSAWLVPWLVSAGCAVAAGAVLQLDRSRRLRGHSRVQSVARTWLAAAVISSVIGLIQYFGVSSLLSPWISAAAPGEAFANLRQRNQLASLMAIGIAAVLWSAPSLKRRHAVPAIVLLAAGSAASSSRTGLLQLLTLAALALAWRAPGQSARRALCLGAAAAYFASAQLLPIILEAATGVVPDTIWDRWLGADGCGSRAVLWSNIWHLITLRPWLGWGMGELDYAHYATLYPGVRFCDILDNAHNLPLHLAVEFGLPAAGLVVASGAYVAFRARPWAETDPQRQMAWAVVAVILLHSLLEYPLWYGPFQIAFGLCIWILWRPVRAAGDQACPARPTAAASLAVAIASAALAYAAWDYRRVSQIYMPPEARAAAYREDPLAHLRGSWLFGQQVRFAELTLAPLTRNNAQWTYDTATALLHFSPEPKVIEKVIESALLLGREEEALLHMARFRAAFPEAYAAWKLDAPRPGTPR